MLNPDIDSKLVSVLNRKLLRDLSYRERTAYAKLGKYRKAEELPGRWKSFLRSDR